MCFPLLTRNGSYTELVLSCYLVTNVLRPVADAKHPIESCNLAMPIAQLQSDRPAERQNCKTAKQQKWAGARRRCLPISAPIGSPGTQVAVSPARKIIFSGENFCPLLPAIRRQGSLFS